MDFNGKHTRAFEKKYNMIDVRRIRSKKRVIGGKLSNITHIILEAIFKERSIELDQLKLNGKL